VCIVRQLALQYPESSLNSGPFLIYLTARDKNRGEAALKTLHEDAQLQKANALKQHGGLSEIKYHQLDITESESVDAFAAHLKQAHGKGIDLVVNNAGIAMDGFGTTALLQAALHALTLHRLQYCEDDSWCELLQHNGSMPYLSPTTQARRPAC
jgi:NAD(P)-dependent dehydrogenase (short-subunit alcohol dehydrogenase family)